jgi:hypothetical protein
MHDDDAANPISSWPYTRVEAAAGAEDVLGAAYEESARLRRVRNAVWRCRLTLSNPR